MEVQHPQIVDCPECGSDRLRGVEKVGVRLRTDGEGGISQWDMEQGLNSFTSLHCANCAHAFIEDGEVVDERAKPE